MTRGISQPKRARTQSPVGGKAHFTSLRDFPHALAEMDDLRAVKREVDTNLGDRRNYPPGARNLRAGTVVHHSREDLAAQISTGSFRTCGMVVAPCSVKSLAQIATGVCDTLLAQAADETIRDRRRLVLMVRETPLSLTHLRNMSDVTMAGAIIAPPVPAFYIRPSTIDGIVDHSVERVLDLLDIDAGSMLRWGEMSRLIDENQSSTAPTSAASLVE